MKIELVLIDKDGVTRREESVSEKATVEAVLKELVIPFNEETGFSVFSRRVSLDTVLNDRDRLTVASPLVCDIKKVRSERALKQGDIRVVTCGRHGGRRQVITKD